MAHITGGQLAAKALKQMGVTTVFTLSGGHIIDIYNGFVDEGIRVIHVRQTRQRPMPLRRGPGLPALPAWLW